MKLNRIIISILLVACIVGLCLGNTVASLDTPKNLLVHYLDVGQADSILIQLPDSKVALIDAGNKDDSAKIIKYLKDLKINKIDYLIGTHPHEDHIGGMADIVKAFQVDKIYMPKVTTTTATYKYLITTIKNKKLTIIEAKAGVDIVANNLFKFTVLAPTLTKYEDMNNYSIVAKLVYNKNSFLFTGDAEKISEDLIIKAKYNLKADVLKVGHHGSTSSTSTAFARAVSPKYSIISVGLYNVYNHPDNIIINRLKLYGEVHRTDKEGTIIVMSDGSKITLKAEKKLVATQTTVPKDYTVYITKTGSKYHKADCSYLSSSKIQIKLSEAKQKGLTPCDRCKP